MNVLAVLALGLSVADPRDVRQALKSL